MEVIKYNPAKHRDMLISWYKQWDINPNVIRLMPSTGLIIEDVCCGFIYHMTDTLCNFESGITNRTIEPAIKAQGVALLTSSMIDLATELGYTEATFYSNLDSVINKAVATGWNKSEEPYYLMHKTLGAR